MDDEDNIETVMGEIESEKQEDIPDSLRKRSVMVRESKRDGMPEKTVTVVNGHKEPSEKNSQEYIEDTFSSEVDGTGSKAALLRQTAMQKVRERTLTIQRNLLKQTERQMAESIDQFMEELEAVEVPKRYRLFMGDFNPRPQRKKSPSGSLPDKEFLPRNSLLTDLFEINHIQTIYHIFIAILLLLFLNTIVYDIVETGTISLDFQMIQWAFGNFRTVLAIWVAMMLCSLVIVYPAFNTWANRKYFLGKNPLWLRIWDGLWLAFYVAYISLAIYIPAKEIMVTDLPPASSVTLLLEQVRLIMKTHAFVRSNIPRALSSQPSLRKRTVSFDKDGDEELDADSPCPDFSKYLYFLFAPTLIYRDSYPRTRRIKWSWVGWNFAQVLGVLFYLYFIFVRFCVPVFRQFGSAHEPFTAKAMVLSVFGCMMPGTLVLLCGFFCLLHAWLNAFAEMLRFADRMFYKDWWNSSSYASYYRTWNVVVHDWLYTYVYKDVYELCGRRSRILPMLVVFVVSSVFHEYVLTFMFHSFYPILLVMFGGFGMMFAFLTEMERTRRLGNIFMWVTLFMGTGLLMSLYSMEYYARINCPPTLDSWLDFFVPRSWTCRNV